MSGTVAVVPLRGAAGAKTRLAPIFSPEERARLAWAMLAHVLDVIAASGAVDHTLIVSREPDEVRRQVGDAPDRTILPQPPDHRGLNAALRLGRERALEDGYDGMLVLPGDLPLLTPAEIAHLIRPDAPVILAPDRHGSGTNALLLRLDTPAARQLAFGFGPQSFQRHGEEAQRLGVAMVTALAPGLARDLDTPEDWRALPPAARERLLAAIAEPVCAAAPS